MLKIIKGKKTKNVNAIIEITKQNQLSVVTISDNVMKKILNDINKIGGKK